MDSGECGGALPGRTPSDRDGTPWHSTSTRGHTQNLQELRLLLGDTLLPAERREEAVPQGQRAHQAAHHTLSTLHLFAGRFPSKTLFFIIIRIYYYYHYISIYSWAGTSAVLWADPWAAGTSLPSAWYLVVGFGWAFNADQGWCCPLGSSLCFQLHCTPKMG